MTKRLCYVCKYVEIIDINVVTINNNKMINMIFNEYIFE